MDRIVDNLVDPIRIGWVWVIVSLWYVFLTSHDTIFTAAYVAFTVYTLFINIVATYRAAKGQ